MHTQEIDPDNFPPFSRLFVFVKFEEENPPVCLNEQQLRRLKSIFEGYGFLQYLRAVRPKKAQKGIICFVKYGKVSSAATALETLDGKHFELLTEVQAREGQELEQVSLHISLQIKIAEPKGGLDLPPSMLAEDNPPRSRLFCTFGRSVSEEAFSQRANALDGIEYCKVVKDRNTSESKGYAYLKFNSASSAAFAMEALDGSVVDGHRLTAQIADPKGHQKIKAQVSSGPGTSPTHMTTSPVGSPPGTIVVGSPPQSPPLPIPNGFMPSSAHTSSSPSPLSPGRSLSPTSPMRVEASRPIPVPMPMNGMPPAMHPQMAVPMPMSPPHMAPVMSPPMPPVIFGTPPMLAGVPSYTVENRIGGCSYFVDTHDPSYYQQLFFQCSTQASHELLISLFNGFPGMEYCDLKAEPGSDQSLGHGYVFYSTPMAAIQAQQHLDGVVVSGSSMKVSFAPPTQRSAPSYWQGGLQRHNTSLDARDFPIGSRLFVSVGKGMSMQHLRDALASISGLEYVRFLKPTCGYAKFTTPEAANYAVQCYNEKTIQGVKVYVQIADPPRPASPSSTSENSSADGVMDKKTNGFQEGSSNPRVAVCR